METSAETAVERPAFEAGNMPLADFERMQRELDASREFYVKYNHEFEKKRNNLEKYFGKIENPNFFGQAQEEVKNLKDLYDKKSKEYVKEYLATMRKFYEENDKLKGRVLEEAMMEEARYLGLRDAIKSEKLKDQAELEIESGSSGKIIESFRNTFKSRLKSAWEGFWGGAKRSARVAEYVVKSEADDIKQNIGAINIGAEMAVDAIETAASSTKRNIRKEILNRRQIGRKRNEETKKDESIVDVEIPREESGADNFADVEIEKESEPIAEESKKTEIKKEDLTEKIFIQRIMNNDRSVWNEYKGKNIKSIIKGSDPRREDKKKFFSNLGKIIDFSREDLGGDFMNNEIKVGNWLLRIFGEAERRKKVKDIFEIIEGE